jgi:hypothetical protein
MNGGEPSIKPIIAHPQSDVADARQQPLVQVDTAVLHAEWIEPALGAVVGPLGYAI